MKNELISRQLIAGVIICMAVLALLSYLLPATLAAYFFPGLARLSAVETVPSQELGHVRPAFTAAALLSDRPDPFGRPAEKSSPKKTT